jgi:chromate transporter
MLEEEWCRRKQWMAPERFSQLLAIVKCFPGPVATQMVIALGRIGWGARGAALGGLLFVLPAFLLVLVLAVLYQQASWGGSHAGWFWSGMQLGAIAVILISVAQLGRAYRRVGQAWVIAGLSAAVTARFPQYEPFLILGFGLFSEGLRWFLSRRSRPPVLLSVSVVPAMLLGSEWLARLSEIFWICFKAGTFVFGTGLAVIPVLEADFVGRLGWLTHVQFMDAVAVGQVTPGPVTISATFLGYQVAGMSGALVATGGIFLTAFCNGIWTIPWLWSRVGAKGTGFASAWLAGAVPAVVGGVFGSGLRLFYLTWEGGAMPALDVGVVMLAATAALVFARTPAWGVILGAGALASALEQLTKIFF